MATKLPFDCSCTDVWASPENWKSLKTKKSLDLNWYVQCKFFDPVFKDKYPNGFPFRRKVNKFKTVDERKAAIEILLCEMPRLLEKGYNPITKKYMIPDSVDVNNSLHPQLESYKAIELAWDKILTSALKNKSKKVNKPFDDVRVAKNRFIKGLKELRYESIPIKDLKTSMARETLEHMNIPDAYYNKFLAYLSKIFTELIEYGCVENNPFKLFKKRKTVKRTRETLPLKTFQDIMDYLYQNHYNFYRYTMIFHMSGARSTELMLVQKKDVDLKNQEYKVLIKKGNQYTEEIKVILLDALPYWNEVLQESKSDNDYLFSTGLKPGPVPVAARQISRKWNKYIKDRFSKKIEKEITADFYALKHLFLDKIDSQNASGNNYAQSLASHRSSAITNSVYLVNKKKREREALKKIRVNV